MKRHLRWWADDDPTLNAGLVALGFSKGIDKEPYSFAIFKVGPFVAPSGSAHAFKTSLHLHTVLTLFIGHLGNLKLHSL